MGPCWLCGMLRTRCLPVNGGDCVRRFPPGQVQGINGRSAVKCISLRPSRRSLASQTGLRDDPSRRLAPAAFGVNASYSILSNEGHGFPSGKRNQGHGLFSLCLPVYQQTIPSHKDPPTHHPPSLPSLWYQRSPCLPRTLLKQIPPVSPQLQAFDLP